MTFYLVLHLVFGLVAGLTVRCIRKEFATTRRNTWLQYSFGLGACLAFAAAIWTFKLSDEISKGHAAMLLLASFVLVAFLGGSRPHDA